MITPRLLCARIATLVSPFPLRIGAPSQRRTPLGLGDSINLNGAIDSISIWSRALGESEIKALMFTRPRQDAQHLVAFWGFDEEEGEEVRDWSVHGLHGKLRVLRCLLPIQSLACNLIEYSGQSSSCGGPATTHSTSQRRSKAATRGRRVPVLWRLPWHHWHAHHCALWHAAGAPQAALQEQSQHHGEGATTEKRLRGWLALRRVAVIR